MGQQDCSEREKFENELKRILEASDAAGILLRVIGSLAFQMHCPKFGYLQAAMGRAYTDIDFAAYHKQTKQIPVMMARMGYVENREVLSFPKVNAPSLINRTLVCMWMSSMGNSISAMPLLGDRFEVDSPTIPLTELLLEKMQIVQINEKDIIDTIMLLLEHPLGDIDREPLTSISLRHCAPTIRGCGEPLR